jgi:hypothetical protein
MIHLNRLELLCKDRNKDQQHTSLRGKILLPAQMNRHL